MVDVLQASSCACSHSNNTYSHYKCILIHLHTSNNNKHYTSTFTNHIHACNNNTYK